MPGGAKGGKGGISGTLNINDTANANVTLDLLGLDDIGVAAELSVPKPIEMNNKMVAEASTRSEIAVTQPIVTDVTAAASIDVKPVDICLTFGIGQLPRARICRPVERHLGMTLFGVEVFGLNWSGYSELVFAGLEPRPHVELGGESGGGRHKAAPRRRPTILGGTRRSGLRLRLAD
jgi:hypothetical protein